MSAVCAARSFGELMIASGLNPTPARNAPSLSACFSPLSESGRAASSPVQASGSPA
jgi:hypothetical protein